MISKEELREAIHAWESKDETPLGKAKAFAVIIDHAKQSLNKREKPIPQFQNSHITGRPASYDFSKLGPGEEMTMAADGLGSKSKPARSARMWARYRGFTLETRSINDGADVLIRRIA